MSEADIRTGIDHMRRAVVARETKRGNAAGEQARRAGDHVGARSSSTRRDSRTSLQALSKLTEVVDGRQRIVSQPPVLIPLRELERSDEFDTPDLEDVVRQLFERYRATLTEDRRTLLDRYSIVDVARKVVGVGSVGTRAFVALLEGRDESDPLFLQVKEATRSVLEAHLPASRYRRLRRAGGPGPAADAVGLRHLLGLVAGHRDRSLLLLAPAPRHEGVGSRRGDDSGRG